MVRIAGWGGKFTGANSAHAGLQLFASWAMHGNWDKGKKMLAVEIAPDQCSASPRLNLIAMYGRLVYARRFLISVSEPSGLVF